MQSTDTSRCGWVPLSVNSMYPMTGHAVVLHNHQECTVSDKFKNDFKSSNI